MTKLDEKKATCISDLVRSRQELLAAIADLPIEKQSIIFLGSWSARELLAHLRGWDEANIDAIKAVSEGRLPDFYSCHDRDWQTFNAHLVSRYCEGSYTELITNAAASNSRLAERLKLVPPEQFDRDSGLRFKGWIVTIARLMKAETRDEQEHKDQVECFNASNKGEELR